ncbi:ATP-binding protein [Kitasatospora sp. NA04385]|uniref:ATP-binding protein n=1 Tax=Kitasatospora sp. NA04385 TaxID=2742135 RepID=UPI0015924479|nr:ATP-binding protein [Kitasatospora sp. NA04385]QKW22955.1 ATP-binding protein [Kitasatospora sp. NA04385]
MTEQTHNVVGGQARVESLVQAHRIDTVHVHQARALVHHPSFELPPESAHFVDRTDEQLRITAAATVPGGDGTRPRILTVSGLGGVGKTALCVRAGHRLAAHYPDGAYYLDLDEHRRDGLTDLAAVLIDLLRSLGVEQEWLRRDFRGLVRQFWDRTRGKRLLLVVDNVRSAAEAEPLLPASAASLVLVTSHGPLYDLDPAAEEVALAPLSTEHTVELLGLLLDGRHPADADPAAVRALAAACAGLPKAAEVAGGLARRYPHRGLAALAERLTADLHDRGSTPVEAVWDAAYAGLVPEEEADSDAARLHRLLPECPGPFVILPVAAALLGRDLFDAEDALSALRAAGLLDYRSGGYRQHALIRAHARRTARAADPAGTERAAARARLLHWLRRQTARADLLIAGPRATVQGELPPLPGVPDADLGPARTDALRWMEANRHALYGAVGLAHADGRDEDAVALAESLWTHFLDHPRHAKSPDDPGISGPSGPSGPEVSADPVEGHRSDAVDAFRTAVAAADRTGHLPARVRTRSMLARPLWEQGRFEEAAAELDLACALARLLDDSAEHRRMAGSAVDFRGQLALARGESALRQGERDAAQAHFAAARADFTTARGIQLGIGNAYGAALQTYQLAKTAAAAGDHPAAAELFAAARAEFTALPGRARMVARTAFGLARALRELGRHREAEPPLAEALAAAVARGSSHDEARISAEYAELADRTGRPEDAARHRARAARLRAEHGGEPEG